MKQALRYVVSLSPQFGKLIENEVAQWTKVIDNSRTRVN